MNTILRGLTIALSQFVVFLIFFYLDLLPANRFILFGITVAVALVITVIVLKDHFLQDSSFWSKTLYTYLILCMSSACSILLDNVFNNYIEPDYKFTLAQVRVDTMNKRREARGIGIYESVDRDKIAQQYSWAGGLKNLGSSCLFNILGATFISGLGLIYKKSKGSKSSRSD